MKGIYKQRAMLIFPLSRHLPIKCLVYLFLALYKLFKSCNFNIYPLLYQTLPIFYSVSISQPRRTIFLRKVNITIIHLKLLLRNLFHITNNLICVQDLEDMGIVRLGHQKKILLAIKRVKDIRAGKRSISSQGSIDFTRIPGQVRHRQIAIL